MFYRVKPIFIKYSPMILEIIFMFYIGTIQSKKNFAYEAVKAMGQLVLLPCIMGIDSGLSLGK